MAGTVPTITPGSITGMTGLKERPVYFLKLNGSVAANLVVKGDAPQHIGMTDQDAEVSIKWGSKLMKNVNSPLVNTKVMTPAEVTIFKQAALAAFQAGSPQYDNVAPLPGALPYIWVKMPMVAGLTDANTYEKVMVYDKKQSEAQGKKVEKESELPSVRAVKRNIVKFSDSAVWAELGKVLAVDIFNGNSDRFDVATGAWVNEGNVMFVTGGPKPVIGLDTFNPNGRDLANLNSKGGFDAMRSLIDQVRRHTFAQACVLSVGATLKATYKKAGGGTAGFTLPVAQADGTVVNQPVDFATMDRMFLPFADDLEGGILAGANQLKQYLQGKVQKYAPPQPAQPVQPFQTARPLPQARAAPIMGTQRGAQAARPGPQAMPQMPALPPLPGLPPLPALPAIPALPPLPAVPGKTIPQGIIDRMTYLGW